MHQWQTLWSISGPELPKKPIWVTDYIHIRPRNTEEASEKDSPAFLNPKLTMPEGLYVVNYPPRDEVQGSHRVQINIEAETEDDAVKKAEQICERLTASLSLTVSGTPYFTQLLKFRRADQTQEQYAWSQSVRISVLEMPSEMEDEKLKFSFKLSRFVENDPTANNAFLHLLTAWQLQATSGSKPLQRSILQHYVLSVEAIVNGVMSKVRREKKDSIKLAERKFSKEVSDGLPKRADKAKAIREASTKLREISLVNMVPSIDMIGPMIGIPDDICSNAKDLYRFRSRNLSHPGKKQDEEMKHWLNSGSKSHEHCLADKVARVFLMSYYTHASK